MEEIDGITVEYFKMEKSGFSSESILKKFFGNFEKGFFIVGRNKSKANMVIDNKASVSPEHLKISYPSQKEEKKGEIVIGVANTAINPTYYENEASENEV